MEIETQEEVQLEQKSILHQVTPLSKYLALTLFILLPFLGGWVGYTYAPERVVEVEKIIVKEIDSTTQCFEDDRIFDEVRPLIVEAGPRSILFWNSEETAYVKRAVGDDIQPTFYGFSADSDEVSFTFYGDITLPLNADEWSNEERLFHERVWDETEVEWLGEFEVRILDEVFTLK